MSAAKQTSGLTGNQRMAQQILGYVPRGYVLVTEDFNNGAPLGVRTATIFANGRGVACFAIAKATGAAQQPDSTR